MEFQSFGGATPEFKSAVKALDFAQRIKINVNFYAVFFPFIYFFIIGLWRQAVIVLGTAVYVLAVSARPRAGDASH